MRIGLSVIFIIVLGLLCDWLTNRYLEKRFKSRVPVYINSALSIILCGGILILALFSKKIISANSLIPAMWFTASFLVIYTPKLIFFLFYGISLIGKKPNEDSKYSRRRFIQNIGALAAGVPFVSALYGIGWGRFKFRIYRSEVSIANLPESMKGFKIVQLSDTHLGSFNKDYSLLNEVVAKINAEEADLIVHTGDMVNNFASEMDGWEPIFQSMKAKVGKFAVLGNHDYGDYFHWDSQDDQKENQKGIQAGYERCGFQLLNNSHTKIHPQVALVGVENWGEKPFPQYGDLDLALKGLGPCEVKILLSHNPRHWDTHIVGKRDDIALTLSGHTHGGQIALQVGKNNWGVIQAKYKHWAGLYREGSLQIYVNRGLGYVGIPIRVGVDPEITVITLV